MNTYSWLDHVDEYILHEEENYEIEPYVRLDNIDEAIHEANVLEEGNYAIDPTENPIVKPYFRIKFSSYEDRYNFYNGYAKPKGFEIRKAI